MKRIIGVLTIMAATFCNAESTNNFVFTDMPPEYRGCSIGMMSDGIIIAKIKSINEPIESKVISWEEWKKSWDEWKKLNEDNKSIDDNTFDKSESKMYKCAQNDWIYPPNIYTDEVRQKMAEDLANARFSEIGRASKKIDGEVNVYFEICGSGFTVSEKKQIEKEIQEAIQKILDSHFDK